MTGQRLKAVQTELHTAESTLKEVKAEEPNEATFNFLKKNLLPPQHTHTERGRSSLLLTCQRD